VNVVKAKRDNPTEPVEIELDNGSMLEADELLVAVGRTPKTGDIGLETVGLKPQQRLDVDDTCLVQGLDENDWLYAIGDINHRVLLTHMGKYQGRACAKAILARVRGTVVDDSFEVEPVGCDCRPLYDTSSRFYRPASGFCGFD